MSYIDDVIRNGNDRDLNEKHTKGHRFLDISLNVILTKLEIDIFGSLIKTNIYMLAFSLNVILTKLKIDIFGNLIKTNRYCICWILV